MASVILPKRSILDLIDEDLYTVPNSPILNHNSPVYNPLLFQNTNYFINNLSNSVLNLSSSQQANNNNTLSSTASSPKSCASTSPAPIKSEVISDSEATPSRKQSLFTFNTVNKPENFQKVFNDYSDQHESFIQPTKLIKNGAEDVISTLGLNESSINSSNNTSFESDFASNYKSSKYLDSSSFNLFKSKKSKSSNFKPKTKTMKIKTLVPPKSDKFNDLINPDVEPSHSIKFNFNDNNSIFINNDQQYGAQPENEQFVDYNYEYELDDLSDYESDNDDNCFDYYDDEPIIDDLDEFNDDFLPEANFIKENSIFDNVSVEEVNNDLDIHDIEINNIEESNLTDQMHDMDMDIDSEMEEEDNDGSNKITNMKKINTNMDIDPIQDIDDLDVSELESKANEVDKLHDDKKPKKKYDDITDHHCNLINPTTGSPCNKQFSRPYDLIRHQETIHASKKKIFRCVICEGRVDGGKGNGKSKTFSRGDALSRHIKVKHQLTGQEALDLINNAKENVEYVSVN